MNIVILLWICLTQTSILISGIQCVAGDSKGLVNGEKNDCLSKGYGGQTSFGRILKGNMERLKSKRAMAIKNNYGSARWPSGVISYSIDPNDFTPEEKTKILQAMQHYMKYTCLRFVNQYSTNMITIKNGRGCHSPIGMTGGIQSIYLAKGCRNTRIILHELGHAIGLIHEHQRPDRDSYVTINKSNVKASAYSQLRKYGWSQVENLNVKYDYQSIMEYGRTEFSKNGQDTIVSNDKSKVLGQGTFDAHLTFYDIKAVNTMYKCDAGCDIAPYLCPDGLVGKDCNCWCEPSLVGGVYDQCDIDIFG